jgi:competence protein ComGC
MRIAPSSHPVRPAAIVTRCRRDHGISLVELMLVVSITILLAVLVLAAMARARNMARTLGCLANLKQIHTAFMQYASYNNGRFPPSRNIAGKNWESLLSPYIGPVHAFECPADSDIFPNIGSSYDWRDVPDDENSLAGKSATGPLRQDRILAFDTLPGWHGKHKISVVRLNGKAEAIDETQWFDDLDAPVRIQASPSQ